MVIIKKYILKNSLFLQNTRRTCWFNSTAECPVGFTHRELDDLVKHDIRRDVEVEDEILWRGEKTLGGGLFNMSSTSPANLQLLWPQ